MFFVVKIAKQVTEIADVLDQLGLYVEADLLDQALVKTASDPPFTDQEENFLMHLTEVLLEVDRYSSTHVVSSELTYPIVKERIDGQTKMVIINNMARIVSYYIEHQAMRKLKDIKTDINVEEYTEVYQNFVNRLGVLQRYFVEYSQQLKQEAQRYTKGVREARQELETLIGQISRIGEDSDIVEEIDALTDKIRAQMEKIIEEYQSPSVEMENVINIAIQNILDLLPNKNDLGNFLVREIVNTLKQNPRTKKGLGRESIHEFVKEALEGELSSEHAKFEEIRDRYRSTVAGFIKVYESLDKTIKMIERWNQAIEANIDQQPEVIVGKINFDELGDIPSPVEIEDYRQYVPRDLSDFKRITRLNLPTSSQLRELSASLRYADDFGDAEEVPTPLITRKLDPYKEEEEEKVIPEAEPRPLIKRKPEKKKVDLYDVIRKLPEVDVSQAGEVRDKLLRSYGFYFQLFYKRYVEVILKQEDFKDVRDELQGFLLEFVNASVTKALWHDWHNTIKEMLERMLGVSVQNVRLSQESEHVKQKIYSLLRMLMADV